MKPQSMHTLKARARDAATEHGHRLGDFCRREHPCVTDYVAVCKNCHRIALVCDLAYCELGYCGDATKTDCPEVTE